MRRTLWIGLIVGVILGAGLSSLWSSREALAQKTNEAAQWDYKVGIFVYNPGENLTDERRASIYERAIKEHAAQGGNQSARSCHETRCRPSEAA